MDKNGILLWREIKHNRAVCIRSDREDVELVVWIYRNKKRILAAERNRGVAISSVCGTQGCMGMVQGNLALLQNYLHPFGFTVKNTNGDTLELIEV